MKNKLSRKLYIIPSIYLLIILFFFHQHYSQRVNFSQVIGNIELTSKSTKEYLAKPSEIKKLNIYVNGMSFNFNSNRKLSIKTADNILHQSDLIDFSSNENSFVLNFENNINLMFSTDSSDNKITISTELPETIPPIIELSLPFSEDRGFSLGYTEEDNTPVISNGETNFFLALTNEYKLDNKRKIINIDVTDNNSVSFMIQETLVSKGRTIEKWYEQNGSISEKVYKEAVTNFVNSSYFGWSSRFNSKTGMWTDSIGNQQFNENTASSYLSESLLRGSYRTSASLIRTASVNLQEKLTTQTATYLGNIVENGRNLINSQSIKRREIRTLLSNKNEDILNVNNLINFMLSNRMENSILDALRIAQNYKKNESLSTTLNRLEIINNGYEYHNESNVNLDNYIIEIIEELILPNVSWLDEGLFLEHERNISISDSFKTGILLINSGKILENDFYTSVGFKMIISIIERAEESAFVPERLYIEDNKISNKSGSLLPEQFYYELTQNPFYSKQDNLIEALGSGSWIYTSSKHYEIKADGRETNISINFPKGSIHHFAIKGIKPFTRIYLHNIKWPSDPNFQRYSDGWVYDKTNETLYVKLKHRNDIEKIRILYYYPEVTTSLEAPTSITVTDDQASQ